MTFFHSKEKRAFYNAEKKALVKKLGFYESGTANIRLEVVNFGDGDYMKRKTDD